MDTPELLPPDSSTVYINRDRYKRVHELAIDVSTNTRVHVTPSKFVQHLIDHYSELAQQNWTQTLIAANAKKD